MLFLILKTHLNKLKVLIMTFHLNLLDSTLEPVTNSQYDEFMDDLNSDPEFDKILAEMPFNSGSNIVPVSSTSSAIARSPCEVSNVFSCNYQ